MTEIWISLAGNTHILSAEGHAEQYPQVCAGVSALLYALSGFLQNAGKRVKALDELTLKPGSACLRCRGDRSVTAAYEMTALGLLQIAKVYPRGLCVHYLREDRYYQGETPENLA